MRGCESSEKSKNGKIVVCNMGCSMKSLYIMQIEYILEVLKKGTLIQPPLGLARSGMARYGKVWCGEARKVRLG